MGLNIEEVISEISDEWMTIDGVRGVGQGKTDEKDSISVYVIKKTPEIEKALPSEYKGFAVEIIEIGEEIKAQEKWSKSR